MVWQYLSPITVGRRGVISSFKWVLPAVSTCRGGGVGILCSVPPESMMYGGPGFLGVVWFASSPTSCLPLPSAASCLPISVFLCVAGRTYRRGRGGGARSYDDEKAWSCINHSILSEFAWVHLYIVLVVVWKPRSPIAWFWKTKSESTFFGKIQRILGAVWST
jgi:hypothetical protein